MALATTLPAPSFGRFEISLLAFGLWDAAGEASDRMPAKPTARAEDETLVQRARIGDQDSFRRLVERHGAAAHALALRIVQSPEDAEEIAQDAFVRAWRALPQFRGESSFSTWLHRIVVRQALVRATSVRTRRGREVHFDGPVIETLVEPTPPSTGGRTRLRLERMVAELPDIQRAIITLFYIQDRSVRDVAGIMGLPLGTVKTHLHRSRAALRRAWERETAGEDGDELRGY